MDSNVKAVIGKLQQRAKRGLEKYGVDTTRSDLTMSEWLQHLQEELLDGAVYCERLIRDAQGRDRAAGVE